jgi:hypothetical protein
MFLQNQLLSYSATLCLPYSIYCTEIGNLMIIIIAIIAHYFLINSVQIKCKRIAKQPTTLLHQPNQHFPLAGRAACGRSEGAAVLAVGTVVCI